jgi:hypothetical protein
MGPAGRIILGPEDRHAVDFASRGPFTGARETENGDLVALPDQLPADVPEGGLDPADDRMRR